MGKLFLGVLAFAVGVVAFFSFSAISFVNSSPTNDRQEIVFEVRAGDSMTKVARRLEMAGLVSSAFKFRLYAKVIGSEGSIRIGEYMLRSDMYPNEIMKQITSGVSLQRSITFQEGINRYDIATLVEKAGIGTKKEFIQLTQNKKFVMEVLQDPSVDTLEGYLFPETYNVTKYTTQKELVKEMVNNFLTVYKQVEKGRVIRGLDRHEIVTFASIVEKETGAPQERPVIASVFHNRMKKKMRLQTDPTVLYGILDETGVMPTNLRKRDLQRRTRYNTYKISGLPHGPISNPGRAALTATVKPSVTSYFYFVSRNDGTHVFSESYDQHRSAVRKFQLNRKNRAGKSWRDLNRKLSAKETAKSQSAETRQTQD